MKHVVAMALAVALLPTAAAAQKITKETLDTGGQTRLYYLLVPESLPEKPLPLIVVLHGSNRNGRIILERWKQVARKEGIILAGPDSLNSIEWNVVSDGPHFLHALTEAIKQRYPVDPGRVYLFGHSAGAIHALHTGVLESEYFAAVAAHAGLIMDDYAPFLEKAPRKIPIAIWVGTNDRFFPVETVRATRDLLAKHQFPVDLTEMRGHTHDYYGRSAEINKAVWDFLQRHHLTAPPKYQEYEIVK